MWQELGNAAFANVVAKHEREPVVPSTLDLSDVEPLTQPFVLNHSWLRGAIGVSEGTAGVAAELARGASRSPRHEPLARQVEKLGWATTDPIDLDALVEQVMDTFIAIQNRIEVRQFFELVEARRPRVVVEIGTARGGMLYGMSQLAAPDAVLVSIDLPGAPNCGGQTAVERELFATFGPSSQEFHFIPHNSLYWTTREKLRAALGERKIDLLFIDSDHSYGGVRSDFELYRPLVAEDGVIALHDICMHPEEWGPGNEVALFWEEIRGRFRSTEITDPSGTTKRACRPGEHWRWGIGLVEGPELPPYCASAARTGDTR